MFLTENGTPYPTTEQGQAALDSFLDMWVTGSTAGRRAPVLRRPGEVGLEFEDSTCVAMAKHPEEFEHIKSLILLQPVSASYIIEEFVKANNIPDGYARFDKALSERTGFHLAEQSPLEYAKSIRIPTLVAQVHHDSMTHSEDVQSIYDAIPVDEKKLVWIEGTTQRFRGYNYFGEHPEVAIDWFNSHSA